MEMHHIQRKDVLVDTMDGFVGEVYDRAPIINVVWLYDSQGMNPRKVPVGRLAPAMPGQIRLHDIGMGRQSRR